ncbi:MAG: DUF2442 domain-containing protein [Candidatus Electryonea clarkiae]|nr:DUF2442 domain-containing protein [Candidatus Electryonea clarkiae]MDP8287549.1 DUF2442 domain-containing protein [Candidatus Electryonea clarkiae]
MSSEAPGMNISEVEVTNISAHGIWVLVSGKEYFMSYKDFPWFEEAPVGKIINVVELSSGHLYWRELDIDLSLESIKHPERFPLITKL